MLGKLGQSVKKISLWIFLVMSQPVGRKRTVQPAPFLGVRWHERRTGGHLTVSRLLDVCCELRKQRNCNKDWSRPSDQGF